MYISTLRFQSFLRLAYGQLFIQTRVSVQALGRIKPLTQGGDHLDNFRLKIRTKGKDMKKYRNAVVFAGPGPGTIPLSRGFLNGNRFVFPLDQSSFT